MLDYISRQVGACLFIDEADSLLGDREAASNNHSVDVRKNRDMISRFLEWSDGLRTKEHADGQAPVVVLATNLCDSIDKAIIDRSSIMKFSLPDFMQYISW